MIDCTQSSSLTFLARSLGSACSNLRCNECDFTVVQFPGKYVRLAIPLMSTSVHVDDLPDTLGLDRKWSASADYMFFRENVPNEAKLRAKMELAPG
jgi:hypothetical protein